MNGMAAHVCSHSSKKVKQMIELNWIQKTKAVKAFNMGEKEYSLLYKYVRLQFLLIF